MKQTTIKQVIVVAVFSLTTINTGLLYTQPKSTIKAHDKSALMLRKADISYRDLKFAIAADYYESCIQDSMNLTANSLLKLADCYWQMRDYNSALRVYKQIFSNSNKEAGQQEKLRIAELFARHGQYQQAATWLSGLPGYQLKADAYTQKAMQEKMKKDSTCWRLNILNINTSYREFSPFFTNDTLFYSSNKPNVTGVKAFDWDASNFVQLWEVPVRRIDSIPMSEITNKILKKKLSDGKSKQLSEIYECADTKPLNSAMGLFLKTASLKPDSNSIGTKVIGLDNIRFNAGSISIDNNNHIYFSANYPTGDKKGVDRICIMEGIYSKIGISSIKKLPFGDVNLYSVMHPAVNPQGTLLVCSSNKKNGVGGYDLYYSKRTNINQPWDSLKIFGSNINTVGNEVFPTITSNGYLYFSSDAMPGLGGLDIYRIPLHDAFAGNIETEHISYPINSSADDFGWTQRDSIGVKGYFTSDRLNSDDNIYSFVYEKKKLPKKSFIEGLVLEKQSLTPIGGTTVFLYNLSNDSVYVSKTDEGGKYHIPIVNTSNVIIKAVNNKYINDCITSSIVYEPQPSDTIQKASRNLLLDKFKVGFVWKLSNIHYDYNKSFIREDAMPILDTLILVLKEQPIKIELGSHTDSRGSAKYNQCLSQHRAESAVAYLVQHGIAADRITAKGYGESHLLNRCADGVLCSEAEHQANRRTEVKITGYTVPLKVVEKNIDTDRFNVGDKICKSTLPIGFFDSCK